MSFVEKDYTVRTFLEYAGEMLGEIHTEWERKYGSLDEDYPTAGQEQTAAVNAAHCAIEDLDFDDEFYDTKLEFAQIHGIARIKQLSNVKNGLEVLRGVVEQLVASGHFDDPSEHQTAEQNFERLDKAYTQLDSI